jgi:hypothetical protein
MYTVTFLQQFSDPAKALEALQERFGIKVTKYTDRVVLNYGIGSPKHHPIAIECRGLILSYPNFDVLCRSFDRFFNYEEELAEGLAEKPFPFDAEDSFVYEKIDGTLINLYYDGHEWCVATRSRAFAEGVLPEGKTYADLFYEALGGGESICRVKQGIRWDLRCSFGMTFIFELVSPENRVITPYSAPAVYLLAARHTCADFRYEWQCSSIFKQRFTRGNVLFPKEYSFQDIAQVQNSISRLPELEEGYVAFSRRNNRRTKIKNPVWVALHKTRNNGALTAKRIVEMIYAGEVLSKKGCISNQKMQHVKNTIEVLGKLRKTLLNHS